MTATAAQVAELESDPELWKLALFESYVTNSAGEIVPSAEFHDELWDWIWSLRPGVRPSTFVGLWFRRGAKSTNAEMATVALGARGVRRYGWYLSATQPQADEHVGNIGTMLSSSRVATFYPSLAQRKVTKYGTSEGWRRNRVRTAAGFTVDALGLDTARRGVKIDDVRPDFLVIDDVDDHADSPNIVQKKIDAITSRILPAGSNDLAVLFIQNLVHPNSIAARLAGLADEPADFLLDRQLSGPVPALEGFTYRQNDDGTFVVTGGSPTWVGFNRHDAQAELNTVGISSFLHEFQHEVTAPPGGMFSRLDMTILRVAADEVPELVRSAVWVDPATTDTKDSDSCAIQVDALAVDDVLYRLWSWEQRSSPQTAIRTAILKAVEYGAQAVGIETDAGGDTWDSVFREAKRDLVENPTGNREIELELLALRSKLGITSLELADRVDRIRMDDAKAGRGEGPKAERAARMLGMYERPGRPIRHVVNSEGTHRILEAALNRFPKTKPLDLVDACYWSWLDLTESHEIAAANPSDTGTKTGNRQAQRALADAYAAQRRSRWQG